jgi:membrane-associated phospholipid phosphatase
VDGFLGLQRPWLDPWASRVAHLANPAPFAIAALALVLAAIVRGRPRHALGLVVLLGGANVTSQVLKALLAHQRSHDFLGHAQLSAASYPSGHATASMSLVFAALLVAPATWRAWVAAAGALFTVAVSESSLLLAWHFPSDVVGGYLVATSFACAVAAGLRAADRRWPVRTGREAARRALGGAAFRNALVAVLGVTATVAAATLAVAGERAVRFADQHTVAVVAMAAVAAFAAALPAAVARLGQANP